MSFSNIKTILIISITLLSFKIHARKHVAIVTKVRGKVTKLNPGAMSANKVKRGDRLFEDTSIVTGRRSFVRIEFLDSSKLSLGPNSKIVVTEIKKKKGSVISLLKGRARTKVRPGKDSKKNKFFIKTRTAALGVRGTDFQTIYNPTNKVTNLLTYKGKVAMANLKSSPSLKKSEMVLKRDSKNRVKVEKVEISKPLDISESLELSLEQKETVVVESGQFSGTLNKTKNVSLPVKINPQQLGVLYANENLIEKSSKETQLAKDASSVKRYVKLVQADQKAPLEGFYNKSTGEYAPKSGGFIDVNTGLYVQPEKDASFDEKAQVYVPKKVGQLEVETGSYVAPKGVKLDALKGFVVDKKESKLKEDTKLAMTSSLNDSLAKDLYIDDDKKKVVESFVRFSNAELMAKDIFTIYVGGHSTEATLAGVSGNNGDFIHRFEGASELGLNWKMAGNGSIRPVVDFSIVDANYSNQINYQYDSNKLFNLGIGLSYYLSSRWNLLAGFGIAQENLPSNTGDGSGTLKKVSLPSVHIGAEGALLISGKFDISTEVKLLSNLYKSSAEFSIKNGYGLFVGLNAGYWFKRNHYFRGGLYNESRFFDVTRTNDTSNLYQGVELSKGGLRLQYSYIF